VLKKKKNVMYIFDLTIDNTIVYQLFDVY